MRTITTVQDEIMCMARQDNNTVLFMGDAHTKNALGVPVSIDDFNAHMGGSDGSAQQRSYFSATRHRDSRYWWPIFQFLLDASLLNPFILYGIDHGYEKDSFKHSESRRRIGLAFFFWKSNLASAGSYLTILETGAFMFPLPNTNGSDLRRRGIGGTAIRVNRRQSGTRLKK